MLKAQPSFLKRQKLLWVLNPPPQMITFFKLKIVLVKIVLVKVRFSSLNSGSISSANSSSKILFALAERKIGPILVPPQKTTRPSHGLRIHYLGVVGT
jgi:hypothetical protein